MTRIVMKNISYHQPYFMFMNKTVKQEHSTKCILVNVQNKEAMLKVRS